MKFDRGQLPLYKGGKGDLKSKDTRGKQAQPL